MGGSISNPVLGVCTGVARLSGNRTPRTCIETGTYRGDSALSFAQFFDRVHTIELSDEWFRFSRDRLAPYPTVTCHHGDSAEVLAALLPSISEPVLFFLDAHYSGGPTALGREQKPLLRELEAICDRRQKDILIIDDVRLIGRSGECGYEGDSIYPRTTYDWRNVTFGRIRRLTGKALNNPSISWWDKLIIFRNQPAAQGILTTIVAAPFNVLDIPLRLGKQFARRSLRR